MPKNVKNRLCLVLLLRHLVIFSSKLLWAPCLFNRPPVYSVPKSSLILKYLYNILNPTLTKGVFTHAIFVATTKGCVRIRLYIQTRDFMRDKGKIGTTCRLELVPTNSRREVVTIFCNDFSATTRLYVVYTVATDSRDKIAWKIVTKSPACKHTLRGTACGDLVRKKHKVEGGLADMLSHKHKR